MKPRRSSGRQVSTRLRAAAPRDIRRLNFPVVGVGASVGGLDAFVQLLEHLPPDTGMAFVFVQHLYPGHESALPQILARAAAMPVHEAKQGMRVRANEVFVIPPSVTLTLAQGRLQLAARDRARSPHLSIDAFFLSLAQEQQERAIGIVFSGNAADGTHGLEAIKAGGGITFAQDSSAQYDSMPRNAVAAGCVDHVLAPAAVARELVRIAGHPYFSGPLRRANVDTLTAAVSRRPARAAAKSDGGMGRILNLVQKQSGVDFGLYKPSTIHRRITRRMLLRRHDSVENYARLVASDPAELKALCSDLLINVTCFFRDEAAFDALKRLVFAKLIAESRETVRIWTVGCASGQETYSLAMAFLEVAATFPHRTPRLQIFGTDLNEGLLNRARRGLYAKSLTQEVSAARLKKFFVEEAGGYRVSKELREVCIFGRQDILSGRPFSRMDLVTCRNVLIYIDGTAQKRVLPTLHYALRPEGYLWLGMSESVGTFTDLFEPVDKKQKIYLRTASPTPPLHALAGFDADPEPPGRTLRINPPGHGRRPDLEAQHKADRVMMHHYAPPGVLLNAELNVVEFRGATEAYLTAPSGKASFHVLKMARAGLVLPLRAALDRVRHRNQPVRRERVPIDHRSDRTVNLVVIPLPSGRERYYLVVFEKPVERGGRATHPEALPILPAGPKGDARLRRRTVELEREMAELRDYLQFLQRQHDATQDEMQSSIEEAQSTNEELQTVNEELETTKEELESSNEELLSVNEEMSYRVGELNRLNADLADLHANLELPIVLLGRDLALRHFSSAAESLFNLLATDVGRAIGEIKHNLQVADLEAWVKQVIARGVTADRDVMDNRGQRYLLRVRPCARDRGRAGGAIVMAFALTGDGEPSIGTRRERRSTTG